MKVRELMTQEVKTCRPEQSLHTAAGTMWDADCGTLPVVDGEGRVVAMITDRDVCMAAFLQGRPLTEMPVSSAMSRQLWACGPDDPIEQAEERMRSRQVRRLPATDAHGRLVGILSLNDIARRMGEDTVPAPTDVAETLAAIGQPHRGAPPPPAEASPARRTAARGAPQRPKPRRRG